MENLNVNLKNFQSISEADLEFTEGLNLIVGQSNSGKTAILRAVTSVVNNPSRGKLYIKKGTGSTEVTINLDGNSITWKRTPSESTYVINGETFKKTGRDNLFDLETNSGFVQDDSGNIMNIEGEWNLPFPFDRTPSELFKLFENIFCISDSAVILKSFKEEEGNVVRERVNLEDKLSRTNKKIEGLEELEKELNLEDGSAKLLMFRNNIDKYKELQVDTEKIHKSSKFSSINLDEVNPPTEESVTTYVEAVKDFRFLNKVIQRQRFYKSLPASLIVGDTIDEYSQTYADYQHLEHASKLKELNISRECNIDGSSLDKLLEVIFDIKEIQKLRKIASINLSVECEIGNTIDDYETLLKDYKFINKCYEVCKSKKEEYHTLEAKINSLQEKLNNYKVCPLCGHEL